MSNYSFYGGRDGRPFIINRSFKTIKEMIDGIGNIQIGEYCIINTDDFNHPDNGKIFRRDFPGGFNIIHNFRENKGTEENPKWSAYRKEQLDGNGAKLIGQIVGPAGPAAQIKLSKYNNIKDLKPADLAEGYYEKSYEEGSLDLGEGEALLDPEAETKEGEENNRIYWASCTLRDSNNLDSVCTVGFKIPFTKVIFTASSENAYYQRDENGVHQNLITRNEDFYGQSNGKINPFIQNWDIKIPKGIKGDSIEDLALDPNTGLITYDIRNFDAKAEGTETHYTLNQNYPLTWIDGHNINWGTGEYHISLNNNHNGSAAVKQDIIIPMKAAADILVEDNNKLVLQYNTYSSVDEKGNPVYHTKDLGRFIYQGAQEPADLAIGGLWIETIEVGE